MRAPTLTSSSILTHSLTYFYQLYSQAHSQQNASRVERNMHIPVLIRTAYVPQTTMMVVPCILAASPTYMHTYTYSLTRSLAHSLTHL